jgi:hypothetical protein
MATPIASSNARLLQSSQQAANRRIRTAAPRCGVAICDM